MVDDEDAAVLQRMADQTVTTFASYHPSQTVAGDEAGERSCTNGGVQ